MNPKKLIVVGLAAVTLVTGACNPRSESKTAPATTAVPATNPPATNPPATNPPSTSPPATNPPATNPPSTSPPATTAAAPAVACPDPYALDDLTGQQHGFWVRVSTEPCAFSHRTFPATFATPCPKGSKVGEWVCTFDVTGDKIVHEGVGQSATVWGATERFMPSYKGETVCTVWHNENKDGAARANPFNLRFQPVPGGVQTCS